MAELNGSLVNPPLVLKRTVLKAVSVSGLSKTWGDTHILHDISFSVEAGSFAALLGPSGCGKSTTLRIIAGLDEASAGKIEIAGEEVTSWPAAKRGVAMVFQSYALFPHLSVRENILFGLKIRRVPRAARNARLAKTAELLGLTPLLERKPANCLVASSNVSRWPVRLLPRRRSVSWTNLCRI